MAADRTHGPQSSSVSATDRHHGPRDDEDAEVANTTENIMKAAQKAVEEDWNEVDEIQAEKERAQREYALKGRAARSLELITATSLRPLARPMAKSLLPDLQRSIEAQLIDVDAALREEDAGTATRPTTLIKEMQEIVEKQQAALLLDHQADPNGSLNAIERAVRVKVAMGSGSVANVTHRHRRAEHHRPALHRRRRRHHHLTRQVHDQDGRRPRRGRMQLERR